jgi:hypothetical protein
MAGNSIGKFYKRVPEYFEDLSMNGKNINDINSSPFVLSAVEGLLRGLSAAR